MLPAAVCAAAPAALPAPATAPPPAAAAARVEKDKSLKMETKPPHDPPDAAVLDYLGRYGDAAIGLDPIGLDSTGLAPGDDTDAGIPPSGRKHDDH